VELAQSSRQEAFMSSDAGEQMVTVDLGTFAKGKVDLWWPNGYGDAVLYNMTTTINSSKVSVLSILCTHCSVNKEFVGGVTHGSKTSWFPEVGTCAGEDLFEQLWMCAYLGVEL
jgi:hypothetical protein